MFLTLIALTLTSSVSWRQISGADGVGLEPRECFKDLCTSRRQFCSESEQRCKYCQPAHCLDLRTAPVECSSLCAELATHSSSSSTTTSSPAGTTTTPGKLSSVHYPAQSTVPIADGSFQTTPDNGLVITPRTLYVALGVLLLIVTTFLALFVVNLAVTCRLSRRLLGPPPFSGRGGGGTGEEEEGQALLAEACSSRSSSKTVGAMSLSTVSSAQPPKRGLTPPLSGCWCHGERDTKSVQTDPTPQQPSGLHPSYTARTESQICLSERQDAIVQPSADGPASSTDPGPRHHKGYEYRLLDDTQAMAGRSRDDLPPPPSPPPLPPRRTPGGSSDQVMMVSPHHQGLQMNGVEETYPKSL